MSVCNFVREIGFFIFDYTVIPIIVFLDENFGLFNEEENEELSKEINYISHHHHLYDYENDIIKIRYVHKNKNYIFCINRVNPIIVKEIIEKELKKNEITMDYIISAEMNSHIDLTKKINMYIGNNGCHLKYNQLKIKYLLTEEEIKNFKSLTLMDNFCNEKTYNSVEDFIEIMDF